MIKNVFNGEGNIVLKFSVSGLIGKELEFRLVNNFGIVKSKKFKLEIMK